MSESYRVINSYDLLRKIVTRLHEENRTIVTCNGCFDILHAGHIDFLSQVADLGDTLIVGVNSNNSMSHIKAGRPIIHELDRAIVVSALKYVDIVFIFNELNPIEFIKVVVPRYHCNDASYGIDCVEAPTLKDIGAELVLIKRKNPISTSQIVTKIQMMDREH